MAVKTSPFTGWRLSGEDAEAFQKQVDECRPNVLAQKALERGRALCKQMANQGYSLLKPKEENILKKTLSRVMQAIKK